MNTKYTMIAALAFGSVAFAAADSSPARSLVATPSAAEVDTPHKLEKFLVTGSLASSSTSPVQLEKFLVTGSLATAPGAPVQLEKFMVTGSLAKVAPKSKTPARLK